MPFGAIFCTSTPQMSASGFFAFTPREQAGVFRFQLGFIGDVDADAAELGLVQDVGGDDLEHDRVADFSGRGQCFIAALGQSRCGHGQAVGAEDVVPLGFGHEPGRPRADLRAELEPLSENPEVQYEVPASEPAVLTNMGIPLDEVEDLLLGSAAYRQAGRVLLPKVNDIKGRPLTPLHGGHVGLLCTAGMLNGAFGEGDDRHIAHWRSVKFTDHWEEEEEGETKILHDRERFSHELTLVFANGKTQVLTHEKKEAE